MKMAFFLTVFLPVYLSSATINTEFSFQEPQNYLYTDPFGFGYDLIWMPGSPVISEPSHPMVYGETRIFELPKGFKMESVVISFVETRLLGENVELPPDQGTQPMSFTRKPYTNPNPEIYGRDALYPDQNLVSFVQGKAGEKNLLALVFSPLQYNPLRKDVFFSEKIYVEIHGEYTLNPITDGRSVSDTDMVIVTSANFTAAAESLACFHRQNGMNCSVKTTAYIDQNFTGRDIQEKIRNFLISTHNDNSTKYLLILGNWQSVPGRYCHIEMQSLSEDIPSDLYYSDLDGTWDEDNDNIFGEPEDNIDFFPDIYVGRAAVSSSTQALQFFEKVKNYYRADSLNYPQNMIMVASFLDAETDGGIAKDYIDDRLISPSFIVHKLYESLSNLTVSSLQDTADRYGFSYLNHIGHAGTNSMQCGPDYLGKNDVDALANFSKYGVVYSTGCWAASFDDDCVGWHFVLNPTGGGIAFIGNSRYGWFTPGFPGCGSSEVIDYNFFKTVFLDGEDVLGDAFALHKIPYIALAQEQNDFRWLMFVLNLLGDPSLSLRTETALVDPQIFLSGTIFPEPSGTINVLVKENSGAPVEGAIVALSQAGNLICNSQTDASGACFLRYEGVSSGEGKVTVSGVNLAQTSQNIQFGSSALRIQLDSMFYFDTLPHCNEDGRFSSGETLDFVIYVQNTGSSTLSSVVGELDSDSGFVGFLTSLDTISSLASGAKASLQFRVFTDLGVNNGTPMNLTLHIWASSLADTYYLPAVVENPQMSCVGVSCEDTVNGNGNGFFEPGETALWKFYFVNEGFSDLFSGQTTVALNTSSVSVADPIASHDRIVVGDTVLFHYTMTAGSTIPNEFEANFSFVSGNLPVPDEYSVNLTTGVFGFTDDVEGDTAYWVHSGDLDLWHVSSRRYSSASHSWYCGYEASGQYPPNFTDTLETVALRAGEGMSLAFWHWYEAEGGYDYCIVQSVENGQWTNLATYSGSSEGWVHEEIPFEISGDSFNLRFIFYSEDNTNQYEGWYIDDVCVKREVTVGVEEEPVTAVPSLQYSGPFINGEWKISLTLNDGANVRLALFDISGRVVRSLHEGYLRAGTSSFGVPQNLPSGVYFLKVEGGSLDRSIKLMKTI
ncbi:T9SS type A sorting domain-containing protein [candidate division WOR-3 bacterium]|nr:T9SS type A sorting domain-containing protein [candidate division WOR-3 bacterium]